MEILSSIADLCGILGFLISLYAANSVIKIKAELNLNSNKDSNKVKVSKAKIKGDFVGRDKSKTGK